MINLTFFSKSLGADCTGPSKRKGANFGEGSSVRVDWLCIGCLMLVGRRKAAIQTGDIFLHMPVLLVTSCVNKCCFRGWRLNHS